MEAVALFAGYLLVAYILFRAPAAALGLIVGVSVARPQLVMLTRVAVVAGVNVYVVDVFYAALATYVGVMYLKRMGSPRRIGRLPWYFGGFLILAALGVLRGIPSYGASAIGESRLYIFPILIFYAIWMRVSVSDDFKELGTILRVSLTVFVLGFFASAAVFAFNFMSGTKAITDSHSWRFTPAAEAAALAPIFLYAAGHAIVEKSGKRRDVLFLVAGIAGTAIVFLQHRSVWVAAFFGTVVLVLLVGIRMRIFVVGAILVFMLYGLIVFTSGTKGNVTLAESLRESATFLENPEEDETASWRLLGWAAELERGLQSPVLGEGYGGYSEWYDPIAREVNTVQVHNAYIMLFSKLGLVGLFFYTLVVLKTVRSGLGMLREASDPQEKALHAWLVSCVVSNTVFAFFYYITPLDWLFIGIIAVFFSARNTGRGIPSLRFGSGSIRPSANPKGG